MSSIKQESCLYTLKVFDEGRYQCLALLDQDGLDPGELVKLFKDFSNKR